MAEGETARDDAGPTREMLNLIDSRIALAASNAPRQQASQPLQLPQSDLFGEEDGPLFDDTDELFELSLIHI